MYDEVSPTKTVCISARDVRLSLSFYFCKKEIYRVSLLFAGNIDKLEAQYAVIGVPLD
jgi:hypothetical protein